MSLVYTNKPGKRRPFFLYKTVTYKGRTAQSQKCDAADEKKKKLRKKTHLHFMTRSLPARVMNKAISGRFKTKCKIQWDKPPIQSKEV